MKKGSTILSSSSSSCSSSSSSSCIDPPPPPPSQNINETKKSYLPKIIAKPKKRVRAKKTVNFAGDNSVTSPKSRSSIYRGVTRHRWTGRYEAHLWDKSTWNSIQNKRGRQIYLGAYDNEDDAARTYDLAALKYWGPTSILNFPLDMYAKEYAEMQNLTKEEFLASLRRRSSGFSRGVSKYRGVARHHHNGRWEARIGRVSGNKYLYLGTYDTQEEAAAAYDMAAIEFRGPKAVTNFDISSYTEKFKETPVEVQGIKDKQILQVKPEHHNILIPHSFNDAVLANEMHPNQDFLQIQQNIPKVEMDFMGSQAVMDPNADQQHVEHLWEHFSLDEVDFINSLPVTDNPLETATPDLLELFDDKGFEDDFDFIFDGTFADFDEHLQDEMYCSDFIKEDVEDVLVGPEVTGVSRTPSSSSLSTMTSVSSDM